MNGIQIIEKEISKTRKALKKSEREVEKERTALREAERVKSQHEKRLKQLEEALTTLVAEQEKVFKSAGIAASQPRAPVTQSETAA